LKRFLALSLLVLYINSYTEFHEALRLPVLLEHYAEHKQQVKDMSFWEFLVMHYKSDVSHDSQDNRLPFKDRGHSFTAPVMALPIQKIALKEESTPLTEINHSSTYAAAYIASHLSDIFQPPRHS
jgi:hypothetical protein